MIPDPIPPPRLLARVSSRAPTGSAANRWHEIDLHRLDRGYCLTIRFRSTWCDRGDQETTRQTLDTTPDDLRRTLAEIDPCADFRPFHEPIKRARMEDAYRSAWRNAVSQLLRESSAWLT